jgi:flagellar motor switch protein FliG
MQKLIRDLEDEDIIKANKYTPKEVWNKFLQNMTERKRKTMLEDYEYMGQIPEFDSLLSQRKIALAIIHLIDVGEIKLIEPITFIV